MYSSSVDEFHLIIACYENIYGRNCIFKKSIKQ